MSVKNRKRLAIFLCKTDTFVRLVKTCLPTAEEAKTLTTAFPFLMVFKRLNGILRSEQQLICDAEH